MIPEEEMPVPFRTKLLVPEIDTPSYVKDVIDPK
jgi:hypothetical protein